MTKQADKQKLAKLVETLQPKIIPIQDVFKVLVKKQHLFAPKVPFMYMSRIHYDLSHPSIVDSLNDDDEDDITLAIEDDRLCVVMSAHAYGPAEDSSAHEMDAFVKGFFNAIPGMKMVTWRRGPGKYFGDTSPWESTIREYTVYVTLFSSQWTGVRDYYAMKLLGFAA